MKIHISYPKHEEQEALEYAAMNYAKDPTRFRMKTTEPSEGVGHVYLNPRRKNKR